MPCHFKVERTAHQQGWLTAHETIQPAPRPILLAVATVTSVTLTMVMLSVVAAARMPSLHQIIDPPQWLLPGSPFADDSSCPHRKCCTQTPRTTGDGFLLCRVKRHSEDIYITYDDGNQVIIQTVMPARAYTIGDLITAWGSPTSFAQYGRTILVYWPTRYAYLMTCSLRPDSPIELIAYYREARQTSPWRGFANSQDRKC